VCVDTNKSLKFYDFRHEEEKTNAEFKKTNLDSMVENANTRFTELDIDRSGYLEFDQIDGLCDNILMFN